MAAERAERDADLALQQARISVREAREHVRRLELEAEAEAKAAKLKQNQARDLGKRAKPLGRKFVVVEEWSNDAVVDDMALYDDLLTPLLRVRLDHKMGVLPNDTELVGGMFSVTIPDDMT